MNDQPSRAAFRDTHRTGRDVRRAIRAGLLSGQTSGLAEAYVQANLVVLPRAEAGDFLRFATLNPKPCPVIGLSEVGSPRIPALGEDLDLRTDLPRYRVWEHGVLVDEPTDATRWWREDLVAFAIGCSFSFEWALMAEGLEIGHVTCGTNVPMFRTSIACQPAGVFAGPMVVSMRAFRPADAIRAIQVSSRFPAVHGAPVHVGLPHLIGIADIAKPDYGDPVAVPEDTLPVFWACGVTPQAVIAAAKPPFAITHAPGAMLVTDLLNARLAVL